MKTASTGATPLWPIMVGLLLLSAVCIVGYGGFAGYERYRKSVNPELNPDSATLHFFTNEFLQRQ